MHEIEAVPADMKAPGEPSSPYTFTKYASPLIEIDEVWTLMDRYRSKGKGVPLFL
jgi:hypothetical protein